MLGRSDPLHYLFTQGTPAASAPTPLGVGTRGICTCTCSAPTSAECFGSQDKGTPKTVIETATSPLTYSAAEHKSFNVVCQSSVSCGQTHIRANHTAAATHN